MEELVTGGVPRGLFPFQPRNTPSAKLENAALHTGVVWPFLLSAAVKETTSWWICALRKRHQLPQMYIK